MTSKILKINWKPKQVDFGSYSIISFSFRSEYVNKSIIAFKLDYCFKFLGERQRETSDLRDRLEKETNALKDALQNEIKARESDRDNFQAQLEKLENDSRKERNELQNQLDKERNDRINQAKEMDDYFR